MVIGYTKIKAIQIGFKKIYVEGCKVLNKQLQEIDIKGEKVKVCNAIIEDDTGAIRLSAWNTAADWLNQSEIIDVANCYCKEYKGDEKDIVDKRELTTGKFGKIIKIK